MPNGKPWSAGEDERIRALYPRRSTRTRLIAVLSDRTLGAIRQRAHQLRVPSGGRYWTPADDSALKLAWGAVGLNTLARRLHRTEWAVWARAGVLGLPRGVPRGCVAIHVAAKIAGYARDTLVKILAAEGVPIKRVASWRKGVAYRMRYVDRDDLVDAVERHNRIAWTTESIRAGALRTGCSYAWLWGQLCHAGHVAPGQRGRPHRVPSEVIDAIVATHRRAA